MYDTPVLVLLVNASLIQRTGQNAHHQPKQGAKYNHTNKLTGTYPGTWYQGTYNQFRQNVSMMIHFLFVVINQLYFCESVLCLFTGAPINQLLILGIKHKKVSRK
jgi:hypothetical protein